MNNRELGVSNGMKLGEKIKKMRKARGMTLEKLADMANTGKSYIWELEKGNTANPSLNTCIALAKAFEVTIDDLVSNEEPPKCLVSELRNIAKGDLSEIGQQFTARQLMTRAADRIEQLEGLIRI